jgi:uncharacterized protein YndB with AHSA1/START domain
MKPIRVCRRFGAPARRVFDAWLDPGVAARWLFATATRPIAHVEIDPRVDGAFRFVDRCRGGPIVYRGEYTEIVPPRRLAFTLELDDAAGPQTRVTVDIVERGSGCALTVTHERVPRHRANDVGQRWTGILYGLGLTLRSDVDAVHP